MLKGCITYSICERDLYIYSKRHENNVVNSTMGNYAVYHGTAKYPALSANQSTFIHLAKTNAQVTHSYTSSEAMFADYFLL